MRWPLAVIALFAGLLSVGAGAVRAETRRTLAGSVQLDYLAVPTNGSIRDSSFDGLTVELSLKMSVDFTSNASVSVKVCFACHGFEAAAGYVDLRAADELTVRIGRLTPEFGSFPQRSDPANHRSNDKPLPYDMGRMLRASAWNEGILPAPWVDNGVELLGTRFVEGGRVDYAAYALAGPKATGEAADFDFIASHSPAQYYVDNNSEPVIGARLSGAIDLDADGHSVAFGASVMAGHYDVERELGFLIAGTDVVVSLPGVVMRAEYLARRTDMALGADPATRWKYSPGPGGRYDDHFTKHGFYAEAEVPIGRFDAFARFDGLLRYGNVLAGNELTPRSQLYRSTLGTAIRVTENIRVKTSVEYYRFNNFDDEVALHLGIATPF